MAIVIVLAAGLLGFVAAVLSWSLFGFGILAALALWSASGIGALALLLGLAHLRRHDDPPALPRPHLA